MWQPIETAPKDGRVVVVAHADTGCFLMRWGHIQRNQLFAPGTIGMWVASDGGFTWTGACGFGPSHWMAQDEYKPETPWPPSVAEWL